MQHSWNIICDFDGTIALKDTTDLVLSLYADPEWETIEREWKQGKIGSAECMRRQVELVSANMDELNALLDTVEIDPYFAAFAHWCAERGLPLLVASDGVDYFIRRILMRHGLVWLPVRANALKATDSGFTLEFPHAAPDCRSGHCKCVLAAQSKAKTVLIGDGQSDFCLAGEVDFVIATKKLVDYCRAHGLNHAAFEDFGEVRAILAQLTTAAHMAVAEAATL